MPEIIIDNGFYARRANPENPADRALLDRAAPGKTLLREELDETARERYALYMEEMARGAAIVSRPKAYEREGFLRYLSTFSTLFVITRWEQVRPIGPIGEELTPMLRALREQREALVQIADPEEGLWTIWGEDMPHRSVAEEADWRLAYDAPDFRPFLIPWLLPDQSAVKGNILVVSGGGWCVCDMLAELRGDSLPNEIYSDYVPDGIDRLNADVDAALVVYGGRGGTSELEKLRTNPALPPLFLVAGQDDFLKLDEGSAQMYLALKDLVPVELHVLARTGHGFGVGPCEDVSDAGAPVEGTVTNAAVWPELADTFMKLRFGLLRQFEPKEREES